MDKESDLDWLDHRLRNSVTRLSANGEHGDREDLIVAHLVLNGHMTCTIEAWTLKQIVSIGRESEDKFSAEMKRSGEEFEERKKV